LVRVAKQESDGFALFPPDKTLLISRSIVRLESCQCPPLCGFFSWWQQFFNRQVYTALCAPPLHPTPSACRCGRPMLFHSHRCNWNLV